MSFDLHRPGGHLALDLANTISWQGTAAEVDHIADLPALLAWCAAGGVLTPAAVRRIGAEARAAPALGARILAGAAALRGAVQAIAGAIAAGGPPPPAARAALVAALRSTLDGARLDPGEEAPLRLGFGPAEAQVLGPLAWAAFDLVRQDWSGRLKQCPPADCRWLFIDRTKNRSRRWCDMASCGNRAKVRRHRAGE